jgi:hypothetical protein
MKHVKYWLDSYSYLVQINGKILIGSKDHTPRHIDLTYYSRERAEQIKNLAYKAFGVIL